MRRDERPHLSKEISDQLEQTPFIGGPPVMDLRLSSTSGSNVEKSVNLTSQPPISCMIDLITGPNSDCDTEIPSDKRKDAYNAFIDVTGYDPVNWNQTFIDMNDDQEQIINFTAFYIFFPIFLLSIVVIWIMAGFNWFTWEAGLFLTGLVFIILYGFSILYRAHAHAFFNERSNQYQDNVASAQNNFENSIAYWPQGLFATACAVTASTGTTGWICNNPTSGNIIPDDPQSVSKNEKVPHDHEGNGCKCCKLESALTEDISISDRRRKVFLGRKNNNAR